MIAAAVTKGAFRKVRIASFRFTIFAPCAPKRVEFPNSILLKSRTLAKGLWPVRCPLPPSLSGNEHRIRGVGGMRLWPRCSFECRHNSLWNQQDITPLGNTKIGSANCFFVDPSMASEAFAIEWAVITSRS
jgi:hypothetical protein